MASLLTRPVPVPVSPTVLAVEVAVAAHTFDGGVFVAYAAPAFHVFVCVLGQV